MLLSEQCPVSSRKLIQLCFSLRHGHINFISAPVPDISDDESSSGESIPYDDARSKKKASKDDDEDEDEDEEEEDV